MKALLLQVLAFAVSLVVALAILGLVTVLSEPGSGGAAGSAPARLVAAAPASLLPALLFALLAAALFARARGGALALAAIALAVLAMGPARSPAPAAPPAGAPVQPAPAELGALIEPLELRRLGGDSTWIYAGKVGKARLEDAVVIEAGRNPTLAYVAKVDVRAGREIGPYRLPSEPARQRLLAPDEKLRRVGEDVARLQRPVPGASGRTALASVAGAILIAAGSAAFVRRSRWPLLGWVVALTAARGALLAYGLAMDQGRLDFVARLVGRPAATWAPPAGLVVLGAILVLVDLGTRGQARRPVRRGMRIA